jgi:hypothetical protein
LQLAADKRHACTFVVRDLKDRDRFENLAIVERIILKLIFERWNGRAWAVSIWLRIEISGGRL